MEEGGRQEGSEEKERRQMGSLTKYLGVKRSLGINQVNFFFLNWHIISSRNLGLQPMYSIEH